MIEQMTEKEYVEMLGHTLILFEDNHDDVIEASLIRAKDKGYICKSYSPVGDAEVEFKKPMDEIYNQESSMKIYNGFRFLKAENDRLKSVIKIVLTK